MTASLMESVASWITAAPWLTMVWIAAVGGCLGSFLNVVVYRLPTGMSLVRPGSRCPHCGHAIRARDNIPVLSWLLLRGRCRDCGAAIAGHYPSVEASVALFFAFQWWVDLYDVSTAASDQAMLTRQLVVFLLHASLVCSLLAAALIDRAGHPVPWSMAGPLVVIVLLSCLLRPDALRAVRPLAGEANSFAVWQVLLDAALGSLIALVCSGGGSRRGQLATPALMGGLSGLVLGGFAAGSLMIVTSAIFWAWSHFQRSMTWPLLLTVTTVVYQLTGAVRGLQIALHRADWLSWALLALAAAWLGLLAWRRADKAS
jgi:leader peptidase (prepilin peptidase)/N-methyltransferase